jgi:hypothetical protein
MLQKKGVKTMRILFIFYFLAATIVLSGCGTTDTSYDQDPAPAPTPAPAPPIVTPTPQQPICTIDPNASIYHGMSKVEVLCLSEWGTPADTYTENMGGEVVESWYYPGAMDRYVSFIDGVVKYYGFLD